MTRISGFGAVNGTGGTKSSILSAKAAVAWIISPFTKYTLSAR
jgi:hypothetical protein